MSVGQMQKYISCVTRVEDRENGRFGVKSCSLLKKRNILVFSFVLITNPRNNGILVIILLGKILIWLISRSIKTSVTDRVDKQGKGPILKMIKAAGSWPMLEGKSWNNTKFQLKNTIQDFRYHINKLDDDIFNFTNQTASEPDSVNIKKKLKKTTLFLGPFPMKNMLFRTLCPCVCVWLSLFLTRIIINE